MSVHASFGSCGAPEKIKKNLHALALGAFLYTNTSFHALIERKGVPYLEKMYCKIVFFLIIAAFCLKCHWPIAASTYCPKTFTF